MRKAFIFVIILTLFVCSCTQENVLHNSIGTVSFSADVSRGVIASIDYPTVMDKVWVLTATKKDNGDTVGQGTYDEVILTDSIGPFSIGLWEFSITDSNNLYTGTVTTNIKAGSNSVAISLHSTSNKGTLSIENCNFLESKTGKVNYVDCYVDEQRVNGTDWVISPSMTTDGDYFVLPTLTVQLAGGIHSVRFYYGTDNGGFNSETVNIRTVNGMITHFTIGEQEGNTTITISFDIQDAIATE